MVKDRDKKEYAAVEADGVENFRIGTLTVKGTNKAMSLTNSKNVEVETLNHIASSLPHEEFNVIKDAILQEIDLILQEAKKEKQSARSEKLIQFISTVGSASVVELLKSYGIFPPQQ